MDGPTRNGGRTDSDRTGSLTILGRTKFGSIELIDFLDVSPTLSEYIKVVHEEALSSVLGSVQQLVAAQTSLGQANPFVYHITHTSGRNGSL